MLQGLIRLFGHLSGLLLAVQGVMYFVYGVTSFVTPVTPEERREDEILADRVRDVSLARGDEPWQAEFYQTDTLSIADNRGQGVTMTLLGTAKLIAGIGIIFCWLYVISYISN